MSQISSTLTIPDCGSIPKHVAIIMDGNGRWATQRKLPRGAGHARGVRSVRRIVEACGKKGVRYLTLFAFSSENWRRPQQEVSLLMKLFMRSLEKEVDKLIEQGVCLKIIGDLSAFDDKLKKLIQKAQDQTADQNKLVLTIAANYGGRWDILQAMRKMLAHKPELAQNLESINELELNSYLSMADAPEPDLFIRTGGEQRISNFLIWQLAYTELYFTDCFWPDFGADEIDQAFKWYQTRERRFGRTSEQLHG